MNRQNLTKNLAAPAFRRDGLWPRAAARIEGFAVRHRCKRAWCRHMCPIGLLLGVHSRIGIVDFRPKRPHPGGER